MRGRLGYAFNNVLVYGAGGWAWRSGALRGWTAGGGLEWATQSAVHCKARSCVEDRRSVFLVLIMLSTG